MRLLAVRLQNLNSLSGEHELRFDAAPLAAAGVFLITGPTGAGKSTLLDAMTLALYGCAARYGNGKADEMMSRHTAECFAEVDFETGGRKLRATWRLGKTKSGNLRPVQRTLADATTLEILADKGREMDPMIESLTGLDVDRFLRSVLLAQGQFAAFLKARPNERAELLEKITGTEIYTELSTLAFELHREKEERARLLSASLGGLVVLCVEERAALERDVADAQDSAKRLAMEHSAAAGALTQQRQRFQWQRELAQMLEKVTQLAALAALHEKNHAEAATGAVAAKDAYDTVKRAHASREPVWEKAAQLDAQSRLLEKQLEDSRANFIRLKGQKQDAVTSCETAAKKFQQHQAAAQVTETWLKDHSNDAALAETLPARRIAVRDWREAARKLEEALAIQTKLVQAGASTQKHAAALDALRERVAKQRQLTEEAAQRAEAQNRVATEAQRLANFDEHRHDLRAGDTCPLCGATEHPWAATRVTFESQLQTARQLLSELELVRMKAQTGLADLEQEAARAEERQRSEQARVQEIKDQLQKHGGVELLQKLSDSKRMPGAATPEEAEKQLTDAEQRAVAFAKRHEESNMMQRQRQDLESRHTLATREVETLSQQLAQLETGGKKLRGDADALKESMRTLLGERDLATDRAWHADALSVAEKKLRTAETGVHELQRHIAAAKASLEQLQQRRVELEQQLAGAEPVTPEVLGMLEQTTTRLSVESAAMQKSCGALEQRILQDNDARQRKEAGGAALQTAEAEALRWGRLSVLIGSKEGHKFAKFAQSLTLRQLIRLANEHLRVLAERYRLTAAEGDDLDLRIVDLYQGSVDRPMESLSGGESFLASLALALGLSELASRRHPIDSLFIDEGFGTLDTQTMEVALGALENLRSRGKTIGLISHVDLLKERLTTQVRVIRGPGGNSHIEVVA